MALVELFGLIGLIWVAAYFCLPPLIWTTLLGVSLLVISCYGHLGFLGLSLFWIIYLLSVIFANNTSLRQRYITSRLLKVLEKRMPLMSNTEKEAIEAGHTFWEKELFTGRPDWKKLLALPQPELTSEELNFLNHQVEILCSMINDWQVVQEYQELPAVVWDYLKKEKFFALIIPKEYGGLGFSAVAHSTIIVKIATRCVSAAVNTMVPNSLGPAELLLHYGTDQQKSYYLPRLARAEEIPCFALTSPEAGSDAAAIPDAGVVCYGKYQGKEIVGIKLSWDKRYITLAPIATVLGLAIHLYDPEQLLGEKEDVGITLCLIPTSHPGVEIGHRHLPMHTPFMNGPTRGKDVFIPLDWIIGGLPMAGQGWRMLMECLSAGRSISLPALSTACTNLAYRYTGAYAKLRKQFNISIAQFEGVEEALAHIAGATYVAEAARLFIAGALDQKVKPAIASAITKYHLTEIARHTVSHAMDVHAGHMIQVGPRNFLANVYMSLPISITVEGANILTRNLIIFGQGVIRCHPYLLQEMQIISQTSAPHTEQSKIAAIDSLLFAHLGSFIRHVARACWYGLTAARWIRVPVKVKSKRVQQCYRQLTRMSTALALLTDVSLQVFAGSLKRRERISARLGDIFSQLYLASVTLKYYSDHSSDTDEEYTCWCIETALYKIQQACEELLRNFPTRILSQILHWIIFPFGQSYFPPKDILSKRLLAAMLSPSKLRNRLTQHCYSSKEKHELTYQLDAALTQVEQIDPLWKKIQKALQEKLITRQFDVTALINSAKKASVLSAEEAEYLQAFEVLRKEIIRVDEFSFDLKEVI